jgi:hypothetical protein
MIILSRLTMGINGALVSFFSPNFRLHFSIEMKLVLTPGTPEAGTIFAGKLTLP